MYSQLQGATCCMVPFIQNIQTRQIHRYWKYITTFAGGWRREKWGLISNEYRISFWSGEDVG